MLCFYFIKKKAEKHVYKGKGKEASGLAETKVLILETSE
jgi:hypothetical protein